jgi:thiol-disulfide isomerase/thioredoxin
MKGCCVVLDSSDTKILGSFFSSEQMNLSFPKAMRWWQKGLQPNMREIESAQDLADSLLNSGDKLVVVDFFSPGCGGCRALHPKVRPTHSGELPTLIPRTS